MVGAGLRSLLGILVGCVVAIVLLIAVELFSAIVHPTPDDFDGSMEQMCRHVERYPQWVLAVVVPMWATISFVSTWLAAKLGNRAASVIVGLLLVVALVCNVANLPYPTWFKVSTLLIIPLSIAGGIRWTKQRTTVDGSAAAG